MILYIDSSDEQKTVLGLGQKHPIIYDFFGKKLSEILLHEIKKFLKKNQTELPKITKIAIVAGPGHFSRMRTSVAIANALAYALKIPIISIKKSNSIDWARIAKAKGKGMAEPIYNIAPRITKKKAN